jgi:hypothetical protein
MLYGTMQLPANHSNLPEYKGLVMLRHQTVRCGLAVQAFQTYVKFAFFAQFAGVLLHESGFVDQAPGAREKRNP